MPAKPVALVALVAVLGFAGSLAASAQNARPSAIGPGVGGSNIGPEPGGGGPGPLPGPGPGPGPRPGACFNTVLGGSTFVNACPGQYTARVNGLVCLGNVQIRKNGYTLQRGNCNAPGQQFGGGRLVCSFSGPCDWRPSKSSRAQGYYREQVRISYQ